jgi:hypothetical protein
VINNQLILHPNLTTTDVAALLGMLLGTAGFVVSIMTYLRDRPRVVVNLKWDMTQVGTNTLMGIVRVTNKGRRPIHISVVALKVPDGFRHSHLVLKDSIAGKKLEEGDGPAGYLVNYDGLATYSANWRDVRAYVEDSAGGKYLSTKLPQSEMPSWAKVRAASVAPNGE